MRLAFTGSHSTGKTTLINTLMQARPDLRVVAIKNVTRKIIERGFPLAKDATVDSFVNYINDQLREERLAELTGFDVLLSDRTILDAIGYSTVNKQLSGNKIPDYFIQMLHEIWRLEAKFYNLYIYCPVEFPMVEDGVRIIDEEYRNAVGKQIKKLLDEYEVNYITVTGSKEFRLQILLERLPR